MNVTISMRADDAQELIDEARLEAVEKLRLELDEIFRGKISTPEQVIDIYSKLKNFRHLSKDDYKITFEENTIV